MTTVKLNRAEFLLDGILRLRAKYEEERKRREDVLKSLTRKLQTHVTRGEWLTNDPLTNYFLKNGIIEPERTQPLRDLETRMKGKIGQLIVVSEHETLWNWTYHVGILADERVFFEGIRCGLITDACINICDASSKRNSGLLLLPCRGIPKKEGDAFSLKSEVFVGDEEVSQSRPKNLASSPWKTNLSRAVKALGRDITFTF